MPFVPPNERVAVIVNESAPDSVAIARFYRDKRRIPGRNVVRIACPATESIGDNACVDKILKPVQRYLARTRLDKTVDFLVTTRGVPLVTTATYSVDGLLMTLGTNAPPGAINPYYGEVKPFSRSTVGLYLCTRLDGYTVPDAKALVTRALAARPHTGLFLLDIDPRRQNPSYGFTNDQMRVAATLLRSKRFVVRLEDTPRFAGEKQPLMGYYSWGSNDGSFDPAVYQRLSFKAGALAETAVSTSARTLRPTKGGQSLIADLVAAGVTGVKGYVSEPYLRAVARPDLLFARYVSGRTLAESFYAASAQVHWKDTVLGDPLCAPYAR